MKLENSKAIEGFYTDHDSFLDRKQAFDLAIQNSKLTEEWLEQRYFPDSELFSEDLW